MGQAIAAGVAKGRRSKPVVLADVADNPGSGAPGDATHVLRELLRQGVRDAALALLWDPLVVQIAWDAEIGDDVPLRIGGKVGRGSGAPLDVVGRVRGKVAELIQLWPRRDGSSAEVPSGRAVWLRCDGVDVIVNDVRTQVFGLEVFAAFDAALLHRRLLVVKSKQHFVAAFEPIAEEVVRVSAPGPIPTDVTEIPYRNFDRDAYPWVADPLGVGSRVAVEDQS
jgi:microcystin degradation protein MlrC